MLGNLFRKKQAFDIEREYRWSFRPGLGDIDVYPEVNNGRHYVFCDLARYDVAFEIGLFRYVRKKKYAFVIGGSRLVYITFVLGQFSPALQIPLSIIYSVLPVSGLLIIFYKLSDFINYNK